MKLKKSRTSKNDVRVVGDRVMKEDITIDVVCSKCGNFCFEHHFSSLSDLPPLKHFCDTCKPHITIEDQQSTAFEYAQNKLSFAMACAQHETKKTKKRVGYNLNHLVEKRDRFARLISCVFEIAKRLQRPPQDLQELILCAVGIAPLWSQDMVEIARCFGFENPTDVKFIMLDLVSLGKAQINHQWQVTRV